MNEVQLFGCDLPSRHTLRGRATAITADGTLTQYLPGNGSRVALRAVVKAAGSLNQSIACRIGVLVNAVFIPFMCLSLYQSWQHDVTIAQVGDLITLPIVADTTDSNSASVVLIETEYVPEGFA